MEISKKYKHRLPPKLYEERMLQIADFLCGIEVNHSSPFISEYKSVSVAGHSDMLISRARPILHFWGGYRYLFVSQKFRYIGHCTDFCIDMSNVVIKHLARDFTI